MYYHIINMIISSHDDDDDDDIEWAGGRFHQWDSQVIARPWDPAQGLLCPLLAK